MLSIKEKVAYGLGDTASNLVFQTVMLFLAYFYTDIFGLSPALVGVLFLSVRILDAVTDPMMGALTDRTHSRHGKFRPYLLWLALPFAGCTILAFTTPDLTPTAKAVYAFVTYGLLMLAYTAINIPYSALGGVLTSNPDERVSVQSYRFVFGMLGGLIVTAGTLPLVQWLGDGDQASGYQQTIILMSALGVVLFWLCFAGTKERVFPPPSQQSSIREDLAHLWGNDQWRILCAAAFVLLVGMVLKSTLAIYYVKYYLGREDLITAFITLGMLGNITGCALAQALARRMCKVKAYIGLQLISALLCVVAFFIGQTQLVMAFVLYVLWCIFMQMATPLLWAKMADVVDYGHDQTGIRITGMLYSSIVFFIKLGLALGGAMGGWLLAYYGYEAGQAQSVQSVEGIRLSFTLFPALFFVLVAAIMTGYRLNKQRMADIQERLAAKAVTPDTDCDSLAPGLSSKS